jgi:hypothetical protein
MPSSVASLSARLMAYRGKRRNADVWRAWQILDMQMMLSGTATSAGHFSSGQI